MITLRQHIPGFVDNGVGGWTLQAYTLDALLSHPQVAVYAADVAPAERRGIVTAWPNGHKATVVEVIHPAAEEKRFHQWSRSDNRLMVEHNRGDWFWVVGYLSADDPAELLALPEWVETETARLRREAWNRGDTGPAPKRYRCAEHNIEGADCCLRPNIQNIQHG